MTTKKAVRGARSDGAQPQPRTKAVPATRVDLERFATEFRVGTFSSRELGVRHGISEAYVRKLAKQLDLQKDLADRVRNKVQENLVRNSVRGAVRGNFKTDEAVVDEAARIGTEIVEQHQEHWQRQRELNVMLTEQLTFSATHRDRLEALIEEETEIVPEDGPRSVARKLQRRGQLLQLLQVPAHAGVAKDLAATFEKIVAGERKARGLDVATTPNDFEAALAAAEEAARA